MIFRHLRTIHFHIPKTAGVSIERWLADRPRDARQGDREALFGWDADEKVYLQHATAETISRLVGEDTFFSCYRFAVVRNPFARVVSVYYYLIDQHRELYGDFAGFVRQLPALIAAPHGRKGSHHLPQVRYTRLDGRDVCDYVAYFERLPLALEPVRSHLGLVAPLPRHNVIRRPERDQLSVADHYDSDGVALVKDLYSEDFEAFGYSTDPNHLDPPSGILGRWG